MSAGVYVFSTLEYNFLNEFMYNYFKYERNVSRITLRESKLIIQFQGFSFS